MELRGLLLSLTMGIVWLYSGIILSFVKNKPYMYVKSYNAAKRYMTMFLTFSGVVAIMGIVREMLYGKKLECFCIFTLSCSFGEAVLLLLSVMSLFNHKGCMGRSLWKCFLPVLALFVLYFVSKLFFDEPKVYSIIELLDYAYLSPPIGIRLLIEFFIIVGVGSVMYKYLIYRNIKLSDIGQFLRLIRCNRIKKIDKMCALMILLGGLSVLDSVIIWEHYSYIKAIVSIGGIAYFIISFINYLPAPIPVQVMQEGTNMNTDTLSLEADKEQIQMAEIEDKTAEVGEKAMGLVEEKTNVISSDDIDENYLLAKKAVNKWINHPDKPYLQSGITLKEAALGIGMSRRKLSDFIKSEYGCNFNTWINTLRIEEVKRFLMEEDTNLSLSYIAERTGYTDLAGMSNAFKRVIGMPPSLYRKKIIAENNQERLEVEE